MKEKEKEKEGRKEVGSKSKLRRILEIVDKRARLEEMEKQINVKIKKLKEMYVFCFQQVQYAKKN